ncbi:tail fiber domain-containing protein [Chitinophaga varians]|uniref:tail fiber domain-containing protein n=1 Tax=Chitinophaga varians TaxID=2202339 RepID=UPI00165EE6F2|nr:tail fiber domain-containing protein [Chitinophaga varians]MBC9913362.1 tail fiber domain-containing protein [Chitinophaga varians]
MRVFLSFFIAIVLLTTAGHAQQIYQIRADSVRIYNVCDTAELIIENRTQGTQGFLFNKGAGRTEFRRVRLEKIGDSRIAITGQDTLDLSTLPGIGGVESIFRNGDSIIYVKKGQQYGIYAPLSNETLRSVTDRGSSLIKNIEFQSPRSDSSNGLYWGYNSDLWKIFVESFSDSPAGNLIFESGDNMDEGWIFRCWDYKAPLQKTDVLSLASNRFNYLGKPVWHGGNLNRPMGQHYYSLPASDGVNADYFAQGTTFTYGGSAPYNGPLLSFGGLNGGYDCQINADYGVGEAISFRVRNGDKHVWSAWRRFIHDGEVATKGGNTVIKTEPNGYLGVENWIRVADNTGLYTPTKRYLYNGGPNNWVIRAAEGTSDAVWLALQTGDGVERGNFYANSSNEIGFTNAGTGTWRLRTDAAGNTYMGGVEADQMGRFKGWFNSGSGKAMEVGMLGDAAYAMGYDRTAKNYLPARFMGSEINLETRNAQDQGLLAFRSNTNAYTYGSWVLDGAAGNWSGLVFPYGNTIPSLIFNNNSHGGIFQQTTAKWILYWDNSTQAWSTNGNLFWHTGNLNPQTTAVANSVALRDGSGSITATGFFQNSKAALKKDIRPFMENALSLLNKVTIQQFVYKDDKEENVRIGIIADSTDWHFSTKKQDRFDTNSSLAVTMKAVQELSAQNEALQQKVARLEALVQQLLNEKK